MANERFIKFIPSEEAMYLLTQKGHAFRLLTIIAAAARRYEGGSDGLKIGEALIGGFENYDMSERNYRSAKDILIRRRHLDLVETCRTRKKATTGVTTIGTKVKLLSSNVYDINPEASDDRKDDQATTDRRPTDDEQRQNKNRKKEKKSKDIEGTMPFSKEKDLVKRFKLSEEQAKTYQWLKLQGINSDDETLSYWASKYNLQRLQDIHAYVIAKKQDNVGGYMQTLLKQNAYVPNDLTKNNKQYAEIMKEREDIPFKIDEKYVILEMNGYSKEIPLICATEIFNLALNDLIKLHKEFSNV